MNFALVIFTVVAMSGQNASLVQAHDWRGLPTSFSSMELCKEAARDMGISTERYRCLRLTK